MEKRRLILKAIAATLLSSQVKHVWASDNKLINQPKLATTQRYDISLSQWSFHRQILGNSKVDYPLFIKTLHSSPDDLLTGPLDTRDIVVKAYELKVGIVDLVNILFFAHAQNTQWLRNFKARAQEHNVSFAVLMYDETGSIGASSKTQRKQAIEQHKPWLEAAAELGCKQLRVNAYGDGTYLQQLNNCAESLITLADLAKQHDLELLVENHGNASNIGAWLAMLMEHTNHENLGLFTDFDNFFMGGWNINPERRYDRFQGLIDLAPYTRGVSAKSHHFTSDGLETTIDYQACLNILTAAGFNGIVSAEFEGNHYSEFKGSQATIELLKRYQTT
ncbi:sugar phosphate isomerase/epimerase family protein [Algibacillus agarilyticus]|uniref:sugar phosphate isomerase/epimerase family protein n=1 Tax=Algibacillus agarilyticus TaxID=2234133 RepID=UPI00130050B8|nr:sugar phosphate isomerase/epimerase family protein [Algibacillus agarilyticus]